MFNGMKLSFYFVPVAKYIAQQKVGFLGSEV